MYASLVVLSLSVSHGEGTSNGNRHGGEIGIQREGNDLQKSLVVYLFLFLWVFSFCIRDAPIQYSVSVSVQYWPITKIKVIIRYDPLSNLA